MIEFKFFSNALRTFTNIFPGTVIIQTMNFNSCG